MNRIRTWTLMIIISSVVSIAITLWLPFKSKRFGDGDFHIETRELAAFLLGRNRLENVGVTKAPGPVLFYLPPYLICTAFGAGENGFWLAGTIWSHVVAMLTIIALFKSIVRRFGFAVARNFIVVLYAIPLHIYYSFGIMAESMAFVSVCWILIGFLEKEKCSVFYYCSIGGFVGLILARPNAGLSLVLLGLVGLIMIYKFNDPYAKRYIISSVGAFLVITVIVFLVRLFPNKRETLRQVDYLAFVMHHGRFQFRTEPFDWRFWDDKTRKDSRDYNDWKDSVHELKTSMAKTGEGVSSVYFPWVLNDLTEHPFLLFRQFCVRLIFGNTLQISSVDPDRFSFAGMNGRGVYWVVHILLNFFNFSFFLAALWFVLRERSWVKYWPLLCVVLALWCFHGFIYMEQRYLFPVRPIVLLFASLGILTLNTFYLKIRYGK